MARRLHEGDFIGMSGNSIVSVENEVAKCTEDLIKSAVDDDAEVVTIYYGEDVSKNDAEKMKEYVESSLTTVKLNCITADSRFTTILFL